MKIVVCWSHISGYMAACWRALAATPGVSVFVVAFASDAANPFDPQLLAGIPHRLLDASDSRDATLVCGIVAGESPGVVMVGGWNHAAYRAVVADRRLHAAAKVLCVDTPLRGDWRQSVGRRLLRGHLRRFDRVAVPGVRAAAYARYLGFAEARIRRGLYCIDTTALAECLPRRVAAGGWPRRFLYLGRYAPEKAIDVLADGYARYRSDAGTDAWELVCCGRGPEQGLLRGPGVTDLGFVPPGRQSDVFTSAGAFVMASRYEPWGVALAEAAAAGLPLICSTACGAADELLRDGSNGFCFDSGDAAMLAQRMSRMTTVEAPLWGARSVDLAARFTASTWPQRILNGLLPVPSV